MIHITDKVNCCGCNACGDVCPKQAISFKTDNEGFWYPEVDMEKCIDCGLCEKVCPIINIDKLKTNDLPQSICYAAEHKNLEVVFGSTSGGLFSALAEKMYKDKGYVGGAIFNDDFTVRQIISAEKEDLKKIRGSKYIQSDFTGFYKEVKRLLQADEKILVCGGPCQMAALRAYLGKDYENLIIVDYVCLGINSPKVWSLFLKSIEDKYGSKVVGVRAKSKELGWRKLTYKFVLANGREILQPLDECDFQQGYLRAKCFCRPSCYDCKFKGYPRISDITLADFWGLKSRPLPMDKNLGTSLVMVNSKKGDKFFTAIKSRLNVENINIDDAESGNHALIDSIKTSIDREQFFNDLDNKSFDEVAEKYFRPKNNSGGIKGMLRGVKHAIGYMLTIISNTKLNPKAMWQFFKYNSIKDITSKNIVILTPHTVMDVHKTARIEKKGISIIGAKRIKGSKIETRVLLEANSCLSFDGPYTISYGSDIELFKGASLTIGGNGFANIGLTIICGGDLKIGEGVFCGRNVTIRDNNGGHYINQFGYKNIRPVTIGDRCWLCEQCTIMPGVKIGAGAVVGAKSFVTSNVPAHSMVSGHPAEVIENDVLWKH